MFGYKESKSPDAAILKVKELLKKVNKDSEIKKSTKEETKCTGI